MYEIAGQGPTCEVKRVRPPREVIILEVLKQAGCLVAVPEPSNLVVARRMLPRRRRPILGLPNAYAFGERPVH